MAGGRGKVEPRWKPGESGNPNGRPKKWVSTLKEQGYKHSEVMDAIRVLMSMDLDQLKAAYDNPTATILEKTIAHALKKHLEKGSLDGVLALMERVYGKAKESVEHSGEVKTGGTIIKWGDKEIHV